MKQPANGGVLMVQGSGEEWPAWYIASKTKAASISALAVALKRDPKSVRRDVVKLARAGVVRTRDEINPGHGRVKIVEPVAREFRLTAVL